MQERERSLAARRALLFKPHNRIAIIETALDKLCRNKGLNETSNKGQIYTLACFLEGNNSNLRIIDSLLIDSWPF